MTIRLAQSLKVPHLKKKVWLQEIDYVPVARPRVSDLVVGLVLRPAQVKEKAALRDLARVGVGD